MAEFQFDGNPMREMRESFQKLAEGISERLDFRQLFPPDFMREHTDCADFDSFMDGCGYPHATEEEWDEIPDDAFDAYVRKTTRFPSWEEMLTKATQELFRRGVQ